MSYLSIDPPGAATRDQGRFTGRASTVSLGPTESKALGLVQSWETSRRYPIFQVYRARKQENSSMGSIIVTKQAFWGRISA